MFQVCIIYVSTMLHVSFIYSFTKKSLWDWNEESDEELEKANAGAWTKQVIRYARENGVSIEEAVRDLRQGGVSGEDTGVQMAERGYYVPVERDEYAVISSNLFGRFQDKTKFGVVVRSANNWYFCDYFGEDKNV